MSKKTKNRIFAIFLLVSAVFLAGYIGINISKINQETRTYTQENTNTSLGCSDYSFPISDAKYDENNQEISFKIKNKIGRQITQIIVEIDDKKYTLDTKMLVAMNEEIIIIKEISTKPQKIYVYPTGCERIKKEVIFE